MGWIFIFKQQMCIYVIMFSQTLMILEKYQTTSRYLSYLQFWYGIECV